MTAQRSERVSLWQATASPDVYESLSGDVDTDVAVVGGGITGLTCAAMLTEAGVGVTVVEARRLGAGTSGRTTGKVTSQHGLIYQELVEQHGEEVAQGYGQANEAAISVVGDLIRRHHIDADLTAADAYVYTEDRDHLPRMQREVDVAQGLGLPARWTDTTDLPFPVEGAVRFTGQYQLHAIKYVAGLAQAVTAAGGNVHEGTRAVAVHSEGSRWVVETPHGRVRADHVVLATLLPILDLGFEFARAEPSMTYGIAAAAQGRVPHGMYISAEQPTRSIRHYHGSEEAFVIAVGESHRTGEKHDTAPRDERLVAFARDRFPVGEVAYRWSAEDFIPVDLLPMIGEMALAPKVYVATGFNKWGLTNATVAAGIITDRVTGRDNPYAEIFSPNRATITASATRFLKHNLDAAKRFAGDRIRPDAVSIDDIPPGGAGIVLVDGQYVAVSKAADGTTTSRSAVCRHLGCIVQWNAAESSWDCPCHGSRYATDGHVLYGPTTEPLPPTEG